MKSFQKKVEDLSIAVTFAEAGEWETAGVYAGPVSPFWDKVKQAINEIGCCLTAAAFAEENCHDHCLELLKTREKTPKRGLKTFLEDIGLVNVPVRYGVAMVA